MQGFRHGFFRSARGLAACVPICVCVVFFAAFAHAAAPEAPQKARQSPSKNAAHPDWAFKVPDRSAQKARWRESLSGTLQRTTFAPTAPAGRYLQHNVPPSGKRLPPAQLKDLDTMGSSENKRHRQGDTPPIHGEFTKESSGWRPQSDPADSAGATPALREERRVGAYADFHPGEDVEFKIGPEYNLGTATLRPEQTGHAKDSAGLGMGMKLKIDF